jgi:hypothetical protein
VLGKVGASCLVAHHTTPPRATIDTRMPRIGSRERRRRLVGAGSVGVATAARGCSEVGVSVLTLGGATSRRVFRIGVSRDVFR